MPNFSYYEGWTSTDLMIKGLELTGKHPTRTSFMNKLRKLKHYNAGGVIPPINFSLKYFGKPPPKICGYYLELSGKKFVPTPRDGMPTCGKDIPGTTQA